MSYYSTSQYFHLMRFSYTQSSVNDVVTYLSSSLMVLLKMPQKHLHKITQGHLEATLKLSGTYTTLIYTGLKHSNMYSVEHEIQCTIIPTHKVQSLNEDNTYAYSILTQLMEKGDGRPRHRVRIRPESQARFDLQKPTYSDLLLSNQSWSLKPFTDFQNGIIIWKLCFQNMTLQRNINLNNNRKYPQLD